jgi:hypothetical protein
MNEIKKITVPFVIAIVAMAFCVTCIGVWLYKGKSAKWVARKMQLGGALLTLTALLNACDPSQTETLIDNNPPYTCYIVAYSEETNNRFYINAENDSLLILNLPDENNLNGEIRKCTLEEYSCAIFDNNNSVVWKDDIFAEDGIFDEETETFNIEVDKSIEKGNYIIRFFCTSKEDQPEWSDQYFNLKIE